MFKSRFAREMVQFNSLTEEVLCGGYYSPTLIEEEEEWIDAKDFKHILDLSENLERNIKLWEAGTQPDDQASPTPNVVSDDDGHQTMMMTVNEIPTDPVALCGLSVVAPRDDGSDDDTNIAIGGDLNAMSVQAGWESRVFSHHIGGSEKRSLAWDGDGGRRSIGLSIFAGYEPHEANSSEISEGPPLNTDFRTSPWVQLPGFDSARITNVNRAESFQTVDSSRTAEFSRSESCRTAEVARAEPCRTFEVTRAESCRTTEVGRAESCRTAEVARAESCRTTEVARAESCRTTEISRVETVLAIGEPAWQKPETSLERLEFEVRRLRGENTRLAEELEGAKDGAARHSALQKELDQLRWQIAKMEDSRRIYETATNQLVTFLDLVSDQLTGSSPSRAKSALDLTSLAGTESRLSLAPSTTAAGSRCALDFLGLDLGLGADLNAQMAAAGGGRSSRASLGTSLNTSRAAAIAAANIRLSLGGCGGGSSLELNNRLRRHHVGSGAARSGRGMPRMGVEGASIYAAAAAQHGGQNIWRSRSEVGIPGFTTSEQSRTGRGHHRRTLRSGAELAGRQEGGNRQPRVQPYSQEGLQDCGASLESKDSGRSTDSCSSGRSSPKGGPTTKERQQLAGRARRMVRAVRQFLAREKSVHNKSSYSPPPTLVAENPWQLKPQPPPASAQMSSSTSSSADEEAIAPSAAAFSSDDARPEAGTDSAQYNKVIISINSEPSDRAESEVGVAAARRSGTPRKSFSFTHSTPRRELLGADNNLIKITKMGTVSVPVPYPITPLKGSQTWF